jgi:hypothetical protein
LNPGSAVAGSGALSLTVTGSSFVNGAVVLWNGATRSTTFVSSTQLTAAITTDDLEASGSAQVSVRNPTPGGGTSSALTFTIAMSGGGSNPVPTVSSISPSTATAGGAAFTLTVNGTGFVATSVVRVNGANRATTFVSANQLTATVTAADIATAGTLSITAFSPTPGGGLSNAQSLTVNGSAPAEGLVAAYDFNQGSGTVLADVSGGGNNGTINGATWTASGRYGSALQFNGTSNFVSIPDSAALDLTTGMTIEAWVYPTVAPTGWRAVVAKSNSGGDVYYLHAGSSNNNSPATGIFSGGQERILYGGTRLTANTWVHLASTYDGTTQRLYVNGVQVASRAQTGNIQTSTGVLRIGASVWGEYFQGRIDDVRIYNRALTAAQIQSDMNAPVQP